MKKHSGVGVVYKAEDSKLKRPVALKFLSPHLLSDPDAKARFIREAQAAAALNHPNICTVYEIDDAGGRTFISMAFLEGASLDAKIAAGPLKLNEALDFAIQTVQGLQAAHGKKIVHRDIKPANLMVTPQGAKQLVTIMDFGLAQLADRSKLTQGPTALGTVAYMSPEQAQGVELDHRTDPWALGAVIYEMVTGQPGLPGPLRSGDYVFDSARRARTDDGLADGRADETGADRRQMLGERPREALPAHRRVAA